MSQSKKWKGLICTVLLKGLGHCISSFFSLVGSWCSCLSCNWLRFEPLQTNENPPELIQTVWSFAFNHFNLLFQDLSVRFWFMICCLLVLPLVLVILCFIFFFWCYFCLRKLPLEIYRFTLIPLFFADFPWNGKKLSYMFATGGGCLCFKLKLFCWP